MKWNGKHKGGETNWNKMQRLSIFKSKSGNCLKFTMRDVLEKKYWSLKTHYIQSFLMFSGVAAIFSKLNVYSDHFKNEHCCHSSRLVNSYSTSHYWGSGIMVDLLIVEMSVNLPTRRSTSAKFSPNWIIFSFKF